MAQKRRSHAGGLKELVGLWVDLFAKHNLLTYASAIAFRALIALVALVLLAFGILGAAGRRDVWSKQLAPTIEPKVLLPVFSGMDATAQKIFGSSSAALIAFAAALTIWQAAGLVRACMGALQQIYEEKETRPWWIRFPISVGIGIVLTLAVVGAVLLATAARGAVGGAWQWPLAVGRWLLAVLLIGIAFGVLVRFAPSTGRTKRWVTGGASLVVVAWVVQSLLFALYLRTFANWKTSAGSLLGVYFLTTYVYVAAIVLLVGMELDEQLRKDVEGSEERGILEIVRDIV